MARTIFPKPGDRSIIDLAGLAAGASGLSAQAVVGLAGALQG
jgi:hypothetical protein